MGTSQCRPHNRILALHNWHFSNAYQHLIIENQYFSNAERHLGNADRIELLKISILVMQNDI
jgi:hypothetical protein